MSPWPHQPISSLGTVITGSTPKTSEEHFYGGDIPFVTPAELDQTDPIMNAARTLSETGSQESRLLPEGTVMVCCIGSLGKVGISGRTVASNQQINSVIFDPKIVWPRFGFYACRLLKPRLEALAPATTVPIVNKSKFGQLEIPVPSLEEQKRIADILDRAEALRAKRRVTLDQLDELVQSIFIEMFGDPRSPTKRKNEKIRVRDVIDIIVPTRDKPKSFTGNIPWITLPDLANSIYIEDSKYKLSKEEARPTKTRLFPKETVILSCAGSLGKVAISTNEVYTNQQFYGLVCDKKRIIPEFLAYYLLLLGEDYYRGISGTSILAFFKKESALNIEIMLPEISNQIHFSQTVKQIEKIKQSQQQSLLEINSLFDSLAHEAFTGKLFSHQFFEQEIENGVKI